MSIAVRLSTASSLIFIAACAGGEKKPEETLAAPARAPNEMTITATDFAFEAPDTVPAGLARIRLISKGPNLHHVQIVRLDGGKTLQDLGAAMKPGTPPPSWVVDIGGPNPPVPGGATVALLKLEPGSYEIICVVDMPDHVPHVAKGMHRSLVVTPSAVASAAEPAADVTIALTDYAFAVDSLKVGKQVIRIDNNATQSHELFIGQLLPGKTLEDFAKWGQTFQGPLPVAPMGGVSAIRAGSHAFIEVDLPAGSYILTCFVTDAKDGQPHIAHGMVKVIPVS